MKIDIKEFITDEQRKKIADKINTAIDQLDDQVIGEIVKNAVLDQLPTAIEYYIEDIDYSALNKLLAEKITDIVAKNI